MKKNLTQAVLSFAFSSITTVSAQTFISQSALQCSAIYSILTASEKHAAYEGYFIGSAHYFSGVYAEEMSKTGAKITNGYMLKERDKLMPNLAKSYIEDKNKTKEILILCATWKENMRQAGPSYDTIKTYPRTLNAKIISPYDDAFDAGFKSWIASGAITVGEKNLAVRKSITDNLCKPKQSPPVPNIVGLDYHAARSLLIKNNWIPASSASDLSAKISNAYGNEKSFLSRGYIETESCAGTGTSPCNFLFQDSLGNQLRVSTNGEEITEDKLFAKVTGATFLCK